MDSTLLSTFSLCASNNGAFKSAKQAAFFASKFGSEMVVVESYSYGAHKGSRCNVSYSVTFDAAGILSITKRGAKSETTFVRGGINQYAENKAKKAVSTEIMRNEVLTIEIPHCETTIESKLTDIRLISEEIAKGTLSSSTFQSFITEQEAEVVELRARIARLRAECEVA